MSRIIGLAALLSLAAWPGLARGLPGDIGTLVAGERWREIADTLAPVASLAPADRMILGHALLAVNRTGESLAVFASMSSDGLAAWADWTADFVSHHPAAAVAHYLRGDALAHQEKWREACQEFDRGLELAPGHALLLQARGVAKAASGDLSGATDDLLEASDLNPELAATHESEAALWIGRKTNAPAVAKAAAEALRRNPESKLAHYAQWCRWTLEANFAAADAAREAALRGAAIPPIQQAFAAVADELAGAAERSAMVALAEANPGNVIRQQLDRFSQSGSTRDLVSLMQLSVTHPELRSQINQGLGDIARSSQDRWDTISSYVDKQKALDTHLSKTTAFSGISSDLHDRSREFASTLFGNGHLDRFGPMSLQRTQLNLGPTSTTSGKFQLFDREYAGQFYGNLANSLWQQGGFGNRALAVATDVLGGLVSDESHSAVQAWTQLIRGNIPLLNRAVSAANALADASRGEAFKAGLGVFDYHFESIRNAAGTSNMGLVRDLVKPSLDLFAQRDQPVKIAEIFGWTKASLHSTGSQSIGDYLLNTLGTGSNWIGRNRSGSPNLSFERDTMGAFRLANPSVGGTDWRDWTARTHDFQYYADEHLSKGTWMEVAGPGGQKQYFQSRGDTALTNWHVIWDNIRGTWDASVRNNAPTLHVQLDRPDQSQRIVPLEAVQHQYDPGRLQPTTSALDAVREQLNRLPVADSLPKAPGGMKTGRAEPLWPDGEWPFRAVFPLYYPIRTASPFVNGRMQ